jgi:hypothetical protein
LNSKIVPILQTVLEPTLELIKDDLREYPEHRENLFMLLRYCNRDCFEGEPVVSKLSYSLTLAIIGLLQLEPAKFELLVLTDLFGMKQSMGNVADSALQ